MERKGIIGWWECKLVQQLWKTIWKANQNVKN